MLGHERAGHPTCLSLKPELGRASCGHSSQGVAWPLLALFEILEIVEVSAYLSLDLSHIDLLRTKAKAETGVEFDVQHQTILLNAIWDGI